MRISRFVIVTVAIWTLWVGAAVARDGLDLGGGWFIEFGSEYSAVNKAKLLHCIDPVYQKFLAERGEKLQQFSLTTMPVPMQKEFINRITKEWRDVYIIPALQRCNLEFQ
jgi:hypothetical protein